MAREPVVTAAGGDEPEHDPALRPKLLRAR